jgi:putative nucleotidyltransferase with HDIG domain
LGTTTAAMFFEQSDADQRHGYQAALVVTGSGVDDRDVIVAALMHDVGKRHARLGVVGRSVASLLILTGLPLTDRMTRYRDHGLVGARELGAVGAPSLAIDFALHHHGRRPPTIDASTWDLLIAADQPPKPSLRSDRPITSAGK